tara:strand:- start:19755 stop:20051 length:297 start_codon:yes stop_codon:yes gene_type:complete
MVLGFILYEAFDLAYNMTALTYNGTLYVYNWYYGEKEIEKDKEIEMLRLRIDNMEILLAKDHVKETDHAKDHAKETDHAKDHAKEHAKDHAKETDHTI